MEGFQDNRKLMSLSAVPSVFVFDASVFFFTNTFEKINPVKNYIGLMFGQNLTFLYFVAIVRITFTLLF